MVSALFLTNDLVSLQRLLDSQLKSKTVVSYCFVVKDGQVLAHTFSEGFPAQLLSVHSEPLPENGSHRQIASTGDEYFLDFAWPIFSGKGGILRLGFSEKPYREQIARLWQQIALLTLGVLAIALVVSILFIHRFTRPLIRLSAAAESIDAGNMQMVVQPTGKDEVGRLTVAFNQMVDRIRRHTSELETKARELDRAHRQMHSSFEIIQKISAQVSLQDICAYLIARFREIVSCSHFAFLIYGIDKQYLLACTETEVTMNDAAAADDILPLLAGLSERTLQDNSRLFPDPKEAPRFALTMGIQTILEARKIVLLATGAGKANAVYESLCGPPSARVPASFLQNYPGHCVYVLDAAAAEELPLSTT